MNQTVHYFTVLGMVFWFFSFLVLFIFTGGLQKTKFFVTIPRVEMIKYRKRPLTVLDVHMDLSTYC